MNGTAIRPLYVVQSGQGFVYIVSTLQMTSDPFEAVGLELDQAERVVARLHELNFDAEAVPVQHALRARRALRLAQLVASAVLLMLAVLFAWKHAFSAYRFTIENPPQVCTVPNDGFIFNLPNSSIRGTCLPDAIFRDGFGQ